ncbi:MULTISPECIES: alcohol dehydrogenase catalytic domain-containing protein [unclassified Streptomyces]|uniref:alcohol dehydrogenase catalytic domain-containing protein n=1 Tax=unclassified Streptomyces TaxID=2593676 RepID=UPI0022373612|nr:alcohol dehydrogenase catalytic domain-containing protein [Streptomyces sp. SHP 1-2]MCW5251310.1 alcohol dehydrogenase catalytic domain-containing protein [Streptomyces sp. SHP 1-2]
MRAAVLHRVGDGRLDLRDDVFPVEPGPMDVRVRVEAAGICRSDLSAMTGALPAQAPLVPGHEGAGVVTRVGSGVADRKPGDHVILTFVPPCGTCPVCLRGTPQLCETYAQEPPRLRVGGQPLRGYVGLGTFARELTVPAAAAIPVGDVPFDLAAVLSCGVVSGVGAVLNTARVRPGESVLVIGCGGVGAAVLQGARIAGAGRVVAVDPSKDKRELAYGFGATEALTPEQLAGREHELGVDHAFDVVGSPRTVRTAWDAVRRGGQAVVVGSGRTDALVTFNAYELFRHEKKLIGSLSGSADVRYEFGRLLRLWRAGLLDLEAMVGARIPFARINEGIEALRTGTAPVRQVVVW